MYVIFLDFDGVLDTAFYDSFLIKHNLPECDPCGRPVFDPQCVGFLQKIIEATNANIVVSSDWKYYDSIDDLRDMWEQRNMPGVIIDTTPNNGFSRGSEINEWLQEEHDVSNFVILDDLTADNFPPNQLEHLIVVNPFSGIDEWVCERAIYILQGN